MCQRQKSRCNTGTQLYTHVITNNFLTVESFYLIFFYLDSPGPDLFTNVSHLPCFSYSKFGHFYSVLLPGYFLHLCHCCTYFSALLFAPLLLLENLWTDLAGMSRFFLPDLHLTYHLAPKFPKVSHAGYCILCFH